ncbi:hypothetical protein PLESTB_001333900 [Pleodorina starrii]|uniref:Uncharacterized protein n=1 Tax=Pleodorina starrii TaxID=330485 RepID=A0A9W6F6L3_9CHLO|nr:hypothetical protein PLESTB_001333900 [Pleodorina starrii]
MQEFRAFNTVVTLATNKDKDVEENCGKAIHKLQGIVQCRVEAVKVDRMVPAGSFGRRTMVRGAFDVDLLVFVNEFNGRPMVWEDEAQLTNMRFKVMQVLRNAEYDVEVQHGRGYAGALKLRMYPDNDPHHLVEVDLMLLPNRAKGNVPSAAVLQYQALTQPVYSQPWAHSADPTREAALSEALMELVRETHDQVKGVVRLLKAWYKYGLVPAGIVQHVPSVLLEVVVLAAAQSQAGRLPEPIWGGVVLQSGYISETREVPLTLMRESLRLLAAAAEGKEDVVVERRGRCKWGYSRAVAERCAHVWGRDRVVILHPIDPTCNIAKPRPGKPSPDWRALAAEARSLYDTLDEPTNLRSPGTAMARAVAKLEAFDRYQQQPQRQPTILAPRHGYEYEYEYGSGSGLGYGTETAAR